MKKPYTLLLLCSLAAAVSFSGCSAASDLTPTVFINVDRIDFTVPETTGTGGTISYTLPNGNCDYIVIGVFDSDPTNEVINNAFVSGFGVKWGTRTGLSGFVLGAQPLNALYPYSPTIAPDGDFDASQLPLATGAGKKWIAIWAYDSGGTLVASSASASYTF
jgi:hypothetical protein